MVPITDADQRSVPKENTDSPLTTETVFKTLGSRRHRYTLHYLRQMQSEVSIRDLSEQLAAWEQNKGRNKVTPKERKRLYTPVRRLVSKVHFSVHLYFHTGRYVMRHTIQNYLSSLVMR